MFPRQTNTNAVDDGQRFDLSGMAMMLTIRKTIRNGDLEALLMNPGWIEKLKPEVSASNDERCTHSILGLPVYFDPAIPMSDTYGGTIQEMSRLVGILVGIRLFGGDDKAYVAKLRAKVPYLSKEGWSDGGAKDSAV